MPIYEYRCERGHIFEAQQRMIEDPLTNCRTCEAPVQRIFHPVAVHFKGSGFYNTDYGKNKKGVSAESGSKSESGSPGKSESGGSKDSSGSKDSGGSGGAGGSKDSSSSSSSSSKSSD